MLRPADFVRPCRTVNVVPYQMINSPADLPERGSSNGGVFHRGQLIWTQEAPAAIAVPNTAIGFVDGLGHVLIDPRVLRPADLLTPSSN